MQSSQDKLYVNSHSMTQDSQCCCGKNVRFGDCCGSLALDREPPRMVRVVRNFVSEPERLELLEFAEQQERIWLTIVDKEKSTQTTKVAKLDPGRVTQTVNMAGRNAQLQTIFRQGLLEYVAPFCGMKPDFFEPPYVLRYQEGGKYNEHADGEEFDREARRWFRILDRDVSMLLYLNDDYEGGGLKFVHFNYTFQPQAGDFVFFPSNHLYSHESMPIISGIKWAVVSWGSLEGTPRVNSGKACDHLVQV